MADTSNNSPRHIDPKRLEQILSLAHDLIGGGGTVLYTNGAGRVLLKTWGIEPGQRVPETWRETIREILDTGQPLETEIDYGRGHLSLNFAPVPEHELNRNSSTGCGGNFDPG